MTRLATMLGVLVGLAVPSVARAAEPRGCTVRLGPRDDLQHAIDHLPAGRRTAQLCLSAGEFRLRRFLAIARDGVTLRGVGSATVLRLADGVESPVVVVGDHTHETPQRPTTSVTVERLRLVGGGRGGSEFHPDHPYLTNSVVVVRAGRRVALRDLDVSACRSACLLTERDSQDVSIERNRVGGSVWDGISLNRTTRARLADNEIRDNTAAGITSEHLEDSFIERNVIAGNKTHGLYLSDSYRNRIVRNRIVDNVLSAVFLTCAIRDRTPLVRCWPDSMSQGNRFADNAFTGNRVAFTAAPDAAATCAARGFVPNRSEGDRFVRNPRDEPGPALHGRCLAFAGPDGGGAAGD